DGTSLLHLACSLGHVEMAGWIYARDPSQLNQEDQEKRTPLHLAAFQECIPILELFLPLIKHEIILDLAAKSCIKSLIFLIDKGFSLELRTSFGQTALHIAAKTGQLENVTYLLNKKMSLEAKDKAQKTPLVLAVTQGHRQVVWE